jgi:drug/metabolite transporter (DMT)-like permease
MSSSSQTTTILFCVMLSAAGQIALKVGASNPTLAGFLNSGNFSAFAARAALSPMVLAGLLLYALSTVLWLMILTRTELSYAYPFVSLGFIVTALYGWQFLHEPLSAVRMGGIALIVLGVVLVSRS